MRIGGVFLRELTEYGRQVKKKLIDLGKTQEWLIEKINDINPQVFVDSSVLRKIFTGENKKSGLVAIINSILELPELSN